MRHFILTTGLAMVAALSFFAQPSVAQECSDCQGEVIQSNVLPSGGCDGCAGRARGIVSSVLGNSSQGAIVDADGRVQPQAQCLHPKQTLRNAARDAFSPNPVYAYSTAGLQAGHVHAWNQAQANAYSWHSGYNTWRFGQPTALVVPPTASHQTSYAWGVGQTRSTPIHHQFGRGSGSFGGSGGGFQNAPYFPRSTNQFGYYPVRASW
jgi:hypothetical protein